MVPVVLARTAAAHTLGVSVSEFDVLPDGRVEARLTFAVAESLGAVVINRDHDGVVTESEVAAAGDELGAFLIRGVDVDAGSSRCPATFVGASLTEVDGLVLQATYACPSDAEVIEVTLYYLTELTRTHRQIARIVADGAVVEGVLTGEHRAIALTLPNGPRGPTAGRRRHGWRHAFEGDTRHPLVATAVIALSSLLALLFCWRRAVRRKVSSFMAKRRASPPGKRA